MKKLLCAALALAMSLTLIGAATVSAANDEVLRGTPTIDGVVDEIYKQSLSVSYDGDPAKNKLASPFEGAPSMTTYVLYDDNYLYLVTDVKDNDVATTEYYKTYASDDNPYDSDVVEYRLDLNGSADQSDFVKVGLDAHGYKVYNYFNKAAVDLSKVISKTSINADGYIVEVAIPIGVDASNDLIPSGELGLKVWLQDMKAGYESLTTRPVAGEHFNSYAQVINDEGAGDRVFYKLSDKEAKVEAPKTFDPALIAVVLTAASGAAFVVASKKH